MGDLVYIKMQTPERQRKLLVLTGADIVLKRLSKRSHTRTRTGNAASKLWREDAYDFEYEHLREWDSGHGLDILKFSSYRPGTSEYAVLDIDPDQIHCDWGDHSDIPLPSHRLETWNELQNYIAQFRVNIISAAKDIEYFGKKLQYATQRFCSRHSDWKLAPSCGVLYFILEDLS